MTPTKAKNSFGIPFLRTGPRGLVAIINQILAALDSLRVVQGGEVTPTGTIIRPGAGAATTRRAAAAEPPRVFVAAISVAGVVPTTGEIGAALAGVAWADAPRVGDTVELQIAAITRFRATVCPTPGLGFGAFLVSFSAGGGTYSAQLVQVGLL